MQLEYVLLHTTVHSLFLHFLLVFIIELLKVLRLHSTIARGRCELFQTHTFSFHDRCRNFGESHKLLIARLILLEVQLHFIDGNILDPLLLRLQQSVLEGTSKLGRCQLRLHISLWFCNCHGHWYHICATLRIVDRLSRWLLCSTHVFRCEFY